MLLPLTSTILFNSVQHRCVAHAYVKFMKSICFSDQVIGKIKATSFGHLYKLPKCIVPSSDLNALVSQCNGDGCFLLGKNNYDFTVNDIKEILNIPNGIC